MYQYDFSKTNVKVSGKDKTIAIQKYWTVALNGYYNDEAKHKKIPTNYKGFRLNHYNITYYRVDENGRIYSYSVIKDWEQNGKCKTYHRLKIFTGQKELSQTLDEDYSYDSWGNRCGSLSYNITGQTRGVYNSKQLSELLKACDNAGYTYYDDEEGERTTHWLDTKEHREYIACRE